MKVLPCRGDGRQDVRRHRASTAGGCGTSSGSPGNTFVILLQFRMGSNPLPGVAGVQGIQANLLLARQATGSRQLTSAHALFNGGQRRRAGRPGGARANTSHSGGVVGGNPPIRRDFSWILLVNLRSTGAGQRRPQPVSRLAGATGGLGLDATAAHMWGAGSGLRRWSCRGLRVVLGANASLAVISTHADRVLAVAVVLVVRRPERGPRP
jgi:hypothetical protein